MSHRPVRVLVVDDSALARSLLVVGLNTDDRIEVVATARDPFEARDRILDSAPDVMTLDVQMPRMDGVEFIRRLMPQYPIPVVMVSALTQRGARRSMEALHAGAVEIVPKPSRSEGSQLDTMLVELREKVVQAAGARVRVQQPTASVPDSTGQMCGTTRHIVALGASTGGVDALHAVITNLPAGMPGVVVVQHMPPVFTATLASRLDQYSRLRVTEARHGDQVTAGRVLVAPGGKHVKVFRAGGEYRISITEHGKVDGHRPSVTVLMRSIAKCAGADAVGALLTGMGRDGADGLLSMRNAGASTLAQDEATSVVWGMPGVAWAIGAAERLVPLGEMASALVAQVQQRRVV